MGQTLCKCGREIHVKGPVCGRCYSHALSRLRSDPAYKRYLATHQAVLSSLIFNARSYMGSSYRTTE